MQHEITVLSMGPFDSALIQGLKRPLARVFNANVRVGPSMDLPEGAFDRDRGQYRGDVLLQSLDRLPFGSTRLLGLADVDCYAGDLNFIFGQAMLAGRTALVALPRLMPSFYGLPQDAAKLQARLNKEAMHELGHTYGLKHCAKQSCVMHFSNSLVDTDRKLAAFCPQCQTRLHA